MAPHRSVVLAAIVIASPLVAASAWKVDREVDKVKVEWREVDGSAFHEYRLSTESPLPLQRLCDAVWGKAAKITGDFKKRVVIKETDTERWTYEQVKVPLVTDRDCLMHVQRVTGVESGRCMVTFDTVTNAEYPEDPAFVRVPVVRGHWLLEPVREGHVSVTYVVYSEPGGAVPALFARGGQRDAAIGFMKTILARASE